jgi:hypothetical protein
MTRSYALPLTLLLGLAGALAIWFSVPSVFILISGGGVLVSFSLKRKEWANFRKICISLALWTASFIAYYFISFKPFLFSSAYESMVVAKKDSFIPFPPLSLSEAKGIVERFFEFFSDPGGLVFIGLAAFIFFIGCFSLYREKKEVFYLLLSPLILALLASGFHLYPVSGGLFLFIVPTLILFMAEGTEWVVQATVKASKAVGNVLLILIFLFPVLSAGQLIIRPYGHAEINRVLSYINEYKEEGDILYVYHGARKVFEYYARIYGLNKEDYILGEKSKDELQAYTKDLNRLHHKPRAWFLFSHVLTKDGVNEEKFIINYLDRVGKKIDEMEAPGASCYLYVFIKEEMKTGEINLKELLPSHPDFLTPNQINMVRNGFVRTEFSQWKKGQYELNVLASGTEAKKVWPLLELRLLVIDEGQLKELYFKEAKKISSEKDIWYTFAFDLSKDTSLSLKLIYTNDEYDPIENKDRDIFIKRIELTPINDK